MTRKDLTTAQFRGNMGGKSPSPRAGSSSSKSPMTLEKLQHDIAVEASEVMEILKGFHIPTSHRNMVLR